MGLDVYRRTLTVRGLPSIMLLGTVVKVPVVAIPVVLTLHVTLGLGQGFAQAGLVTSAWMIGVAAGTPFQGRLIDRRGLRPMLLISTVAQGLFWGLAPLMSYPVFLAAGLVSGVLLLPGSLIVRIAIAGQVPEDRRHTAFAMDSMATELSYMAGPALGVLAATQGSTRLAMTLLGIALACGYGILVLRNPTVGAARRTPDSGPRPARWWRNGRLFAVLACTTAAGAVASGSDISITATLRSMGDVQWTGMVLLGCGLYSLIGGLVFGALSRAAPVPLLLGLLGLATLPLGLLGDWRLIALAVAPAAALRAPVFAATADTASGLAPEGARASAVAFYGLALTVSSAIGAPLAGAAFDAGGPRAGFAAVGGLGALVAVAAAPVLLRRRAGAAPAPSLTVSHER